VGIEMDVTRIWSNEKQLHALTGMTKNEASEILPLFEEELKNLGRLNSISGGRPSKLDSKGILLMVLMFYRHYDTLEALGAMFNLSDSNVKRWIDSSEKALKTTLAKKNLSHLIVPKKKVTSSNHLNDKRKYILTELSNLCADQKINKVNVQTIQEKRNAIPPKSL